MSEATRAENATPVPYDLEAHYQELEQKITSAGIPADLGRVRAAFECADRAHSGQKRRDGSPYVSHCIAAAIITAEMGLDEDSIISALLHDTIEDTSLTHDDIARSFGTSVADIVEGVTKLTRVQYTSVEEQQMENMRKMLLAMAKDIRVILIKMADRLHNMRTMAYQSEEKQRIKSLETMEIYAPIAHRLGMQKIKWELEDLSLLYLDPEGLEQSWNASEFAYGTNDWTEVYLDFVPDRQGEAVVCCGLGFPWGTYNGGKASGTVWYDNVKVTPAPEEALYTREGEHIVLKLDRDKVTVSDADIDAWLSKLDRTYEAYRDLVGDVPFDGRKIMILNTPGIEPGYWALAGNPILWNSHVAVSKLLDRTVEFGDWGFGIIHEIGHVFSQGNISGTGRWNWNDEIFANFRMSYALEACDGTMSQRDICYRGADVINYYKIFYDETIGAGIPKNNGDALHYTFLRIKERYGWDVYKKAFRELYALGDSGQEGLETPYDKFLFFLSYVSKAAGEDVVAATYTPGELALIEESLRN